ncbi:tRNA (adenosine(37)-N6)-threonylcarbamoyltransferase complex transferase subunit TsaD [Slackia piriformis]|uniref:tRNA (adenosine(37)-N6)-threonylcarbamoyltransferase complex transferase subunit TsaD n=1 Tax=Slackia piriformis TaxID=626934 RepID=UPI0032BF2BBA
MAQGAYVLAFDTANEVVAVGVGRVGVQDEGSCAFVLAPCSQEGIVATKEVAAHRASNTVLLHEVDALLAESGVSKEEIAAVVCGRGPGSFTGVRICMATAKGMASALEVPLLGVSTLDAVAWNAWASGVRGRVLVAADAMRKEVYPVLFDIDDQGVQRLTTDTVVKAADATSWVLEALQTLGANQDQDSALDAILGDALVKYADIFEPLGALVDESLWAVSGRGLLLAERAGGNPATLLPVYTRLSDAEENERIRLAKEDGGKNLRTGVQLFEGSQDAAPLSYRPLDAAHAPDVAALESAVMGSDAWKASLVADELPRKDRTWWAAFDGNVLAGYCGGWIVDGQVQILKIATDPAYRRRGIAAELLALVASDARNLGATEMTLEVRASNAGAQTFYERMGLRNIGTRPHYYSDREDAVIMSGPLPEARRDVAGMRLHVDDVAQQPANACEADSPRKVDPSREADSSGAANRSHPLILAIESSCDETAASVVDGNGVLRSDVVASQIDFHARFGGVVPEIASRKHIEAICGVCDECLDSAARSLGASRLRWRDLDAVAVTYAPGLVGALVVGVAFAKGAAWGADIPLIAVNHLEGHLYANKIATPDIQPPMVVSLVSGGHTMLVHVKDWGEYVTMGSTIDDAVGEAFDKVAKALGLGYPGGPIISKLAAKGNPKAIDFPRALMHSGDLRFSLSGLKTAVTTYIQKEQQAGRELNMPDIAASFQQAVVDVQVKKAMVALDETGAREFCVGGGVSANPGLRAAYEKACKKRGVRLSMPPLSACGDQAAMIALVAHDRYKQGKFEDWSLDVKAHAPLDEAY